MMKTNKTLKSLALAGVVFSNQLFAGQAEIDRVEAAAATLDVQALSQLTTELNGYDYALAEYRLAVGANFAEQKSMAITAINNSIEALQALDEETPENAEVKALLAQAYGYKISLKPVTAIINGPRAQSVLNDAEALAPNNPRVLLVKGTTAMFTPALFGGSTEQALSALTDALDAFKTDYASGYHWGYAEAYTWKGILEQKNGNLEQAKADWQQALNLNQDYGWAKALLDSI